METACAQTKFQEVCKLFDGIVLNGAIQKVAIPCLMRRLVSKYFILQAWDSENFSCIPWSSNANAKDGRIETYFCIINNCPRNENRSTYDRSKQIFFTTFSFDVQKNLGGTPDRSN